MNFTESYKDHCPYCGETIELIVDGSEPNQSYIEDCQVCCRPITVEIIERDHNGFEVRLKHENE